MLIHNLSLNEPHWTEEKKALLIGLSCSVPILLVIFVTAPSFFTLGNFVNLLRQVSINGIIACGMTLVMIAGGFDLSVGAMLALSGVLAIHFAKQGSLAGIVVPVALGAVIGLLNGMLVSRFSINPLIVTLGSRYLLYATANLFTAGFIQYNENPAFLLLGRSSWLLIPTPVIIFLGVAVIAHVILSYTTAGAALFAVGSNERAAFFSGLPSQRIRALSYIATGSSAALAGVVLASRLGVAAPAAGEGYELEAIAAVVIGGTSMFGGSGGIRQTLVGVLLLGALSNLLVLAGQPYEIQWIATGMIIVLAAAIDFYQRKFRA
ncbi:MAG: ABC transporter permease [Acidobacteria bacterium]|nr:ABC transporter permease [Acidobacteriota bacterium]MCI0724127.1 ABC transporter permease [Acidobacteriota bacterium]